MQLCDPVLHVFESPLYTGDPAKLTSVLKERCSGGCNVFHILATLSKPQEPQSSSGSSSTSAGEKRGVAARTTPRGGMLREIMKQAMALASASGSSYPHPPMGNYYNYYCAPLIIKGTKCGSIVFRIHTRLQIHVIL